MDLFFGQFIVYGVKYVILLGAAVGAVILGAMYRQKKEKSR